ncbi:Zinc metalloprotease ZmpB [Linum perenne]
MGGESKLTTMAIKVDLDCHKCRKKIKKVLCKISQIQNQVYDEKANLVIITVWCCSPEKIKDKICCKGGDSVKGIEIVKPPEKPKEKPKEPEKPKEKPKEPEKPKEKPKEPEKPKEKPKEPEKPKDKPQEAAKKPAPEPEKPKDKPPKTVEQEKPKQPATKPPAQPAPPPVQPVPIPATGFPPVGNRCCCQECYGGYGGGPCYTMPGAPYYEGYGRPVYDTWGGGGGGGYYGPGAYSRGQCFSDDNTSGCVVM